MADAQALVWEALQALPRPVDADTALAKADEILGPLGLAQQFRAWWKNNNGDAVLGRLNGGG